MSNDKNTLPQGYILNSPNCAYRIESVLGCGGFGITYLASANIKIGNVSLRAQFAIKEHFISSDCEREHDTCRVVYSNPAKERVENSLKDFISEAMRVRTFCVNHPNIVKVNEVFNTNNTAYYVMEYLDGESLRSWVKKNGAMSEEQMLSIMNPIIDAVQYLHQNRMTHLDIKPDNIMLSQDENGNIRPVLIDFGLSKHYNNDGSPTSTINTLGCSDGYAPIEQYAGITTFSPTADIYALGATMWFCLVGKDPKKSTDLEVDELLESIPFASMEVRNLIQAACALNKNKRKLLRPENEMPSSTTVRIETDPEPSEDPNQTEWIDEDDADDVESNQLFKFNETARYTLYGLVAIVILAETILTYRGYACWLEFGLFGILKQIGTLAAIALSCYGITQTEKFENSKILKCSWSTSVALAIYGITVLFQGGFNLLWLLAALIIYLAIALCYELIRRYLPKYTQIGLLLSILLNAILYVLP